MNIIPCLIIDNEIQYNEIKHHLRTNGFSEDNEIEMLNWIDRHGDSFRIYLNSLKIIYISWKITGNKTEDLTIEERLIAAKIQMLMKLPFFGSLASGLKPRRNHFRLHSSVVVHTVRSLSLARALRRMRLIKKARRYLQY